MVLFLIKLWFLYLPIFVIFGIFLFLSILLRKKREKGYLFRAMNLQLLQVILPQIIEKGKEVNLAEYLKIAEQFYTALASIKERSFFKRLISGDPFFIFEISVHRIGEEIYFYVATPRQYQGLMEKTILGFWPKAQVQPVSDYNIFNPAGFSLGSNSILEKSAILPLRPSEELGLDPLSSITSILTKLGRETEGASFQILIRQSRYAKQIKKVGQKAVNYLSEGVRLDNAIRSAYALSGPVGTIRGIFGLFSSAFFPKEKEALPENQYQGFIQAQKQTGPIQQELIQKISRKISQPLFDVNLRLLVSGENEPRAREILAQFQSSFEQFNTPVLNSLRFKKLSAKELRKLFYNFSFRIFNDAEKMILAPSELAAIFHFPSSSLLTPHIKWLKAKQSAAPENLPREGILIGKNVFRGEDREVRVTDDDRRRHFYIIGQTGTGKSVLLQEMIRQDIEMGKGLALVDPHGDLAERVLGMVPPSRAEDVIYFNPADIEKPLGLNMLEYDQKYPESKTFVVNELLEIFEKLYNLKAQGFGGPMFEQYMRNALLLVMEDPESGVTLIEVPRVLADADFRRYKLSRCKNVIVKNFWELEAEKAGGEAALANMVPYITSKMNVFTANDLVRPIIAQQKSAINFRETMDSGKILIVNLSKGRLGETNSYFLGMIIVGKILMAAMSRADIPEEQRKDFYLYIDEFQNVTTKTITSVLAEARKYRLAMIFGHQFIGQLDEDTRKAIFGNVGSIMAFRVGPEDAKYLITQFEPVFDENDLVNIDNYNAAFRLLIRGETSKPFNIATYPPSYAKPEVASLIKELSRVKYGRNRDEVESELLKRLQKSYF